MKHLWRRLASQAKKEELFPLFYQRSPQNIREEMAPLYYAHIARNAFLFKNLQEIIEAFNKNSQPFLLFKGFDLATRIYGDPWIRTQQDIDFLIPPEKISEAKNILMQLGFENFGSAQESFRKGKCVVELHPHLLDIKRFQHWEKPPLDIEGFWERATMTEIEGLKIPVLGFEDLFLALAIHFVFHHHLRGLKWLTDLDWLLNRQKFDIPALLAKAEKNNLTFVLYATLRAVLRTFPTETARNFLRQLRPKKKILLIWTWMDNAPCRFCFRLGLLPTSPMRRRMILETSVMRRIGYRIHLFGYFITNWHERLSGLDTWKAVPLETIGIDPSKGLSYVPTHYKTLKRIFTSLSVQNSDVFVDLGSGKGRVLMMAGRFHFQKIIGIDIAKELNDIALKNIRKVEKKLRCKKISVITADASEFPLPEDATIIYCANALHKTALLKILGRLKISLEHHPRKLLFIYNNPVHEEALKNTGWLKMTREFKKGLDDEDCYEHYQIYESAA